MGKSVHLNRPGKKHNSGLGLPPIAVAVTGRFLDTVYGHRMIHFIGNTARAFIIFCFAVSYILRFAVSGYSSARPKVSRSLSVEWLVILFIV